MRIADKAALADIGCKHGRLGGNQTERPNELFFFVVEVHAANRSGLIKLLLAFFQYQQQSLGLLITPGFCKLGDFGNLLFHIGEISKCELGLNGLDICQRIDSAADMHDIVILKTAHHMNDGIGLANIGKKLIAQSLAFTGTCHQACDVNKLHRRRKDPLRAHNAGQLGEPRVGNLDDAHIRLNGAEGIILGGNARLGQRIEQGGFAHIRQADDAALKCHGVPSR